MVDDDPIESGMRAIELDIQHTRIDAEAQRHQHTRIDVAAHRYLKEAVSILVVWMDRRPFKEQRNKER